MQFPAVQNYIASGSVGTAGFLKENIMIDFMVPDLVGSFNFMGSYSTFPEKGQEG